MRDPPGCAEASLPSEDVIPSRESGVEPARGFGLGVAIKDADTAHEDVGLEPGSVSPCAKRTRSAVLQSKMGRGDSESGGGAVGDRLQRQAWSPRICGVSIWHERSRTRVVA